MNQAYDLIIIGGGSAGLTAAGFAVQLGHRVALVEKSRLGGDCTWTGCVPSKTLLKTAKVVHEMRHAGRYGLTPVEPRVDLKQVMDRVREVVDRVYQAEAPEILEAEGVDVIPGVARFLDPHTIVAGDARLTGHRFLIATGAGPFVPPISGLDGVDFLTYESVWDLDVLPERLTVVGAGPIGCELAQAFGRLGSRVTLLEGAERILLNDEPEVSDLMGEVLTREGVDLRLNSQVERVWQEGEEIHLSASGQEVVGDALLFSVGRRPNLRDLDLDQAGVAHTPRGIEVNDNLRTSQRHIFAAGDCIGGFQFTHYAGWQGFMAVRNALLPGSKRAALSQVPWATFTDPEVAHAGLSEAQARERFSEGGVESCQWPMERVDRALTDGDDTGFVKLVHKRDGALLGATIVNARAGEMIHEWILAIDQGLKLERVSDSIHIYPTYSTASLQVAAHIRVSQMLAGTSGKVIRGLARLAR